MSNLKLNLLSFVESFESIALNSREMNEYVVSAINLDESVAFFCIEPFYCTFQVNDLLNISP